MCDGDEMHSYRTDTRDMNKYEKIATFVYAYERVSMALSQAVVSLTHADYGENVDLPLQDRLKLVTAAVSKDGATDSPAVRRFNDIAEALVKLEKTRQSIVDNVNVAEEQEVLLDKSIADCRTLTDDLAMFVNEYGR